MKSAGSWEAKWSFYQLKKLKFSSRVSGELKGRGILDLDFHKMMIMSVCFQLAIKKKESIQV